ncbi:MAG: type VI secretion system baseplate subunit TssF [Candidatus Desantisbacteria bacterium]
MTSVDNYYKEELRYLLEDGKEFAKIHPDIAQYLNLDDHRARDPHIERLLESFSFLTARIHKKLDDELPEITHSLLSLIYPHYLCPIPSISILEFSPIKGRISESYVIPQNTMVDSEPVEAIQPCRFQTCYAVNIYPVFLANASILHEGGENSILLEFTIDEGIPFPDIRLDKIRLYLFGEPSATYPLYRLLSNEVKEITLQGDKENNRYNIGDLKMVGFGEDESVLPYPEHSYKGYRLIEEYFLFPEKFFFVDICNLNMLQESAVESGFKVQIRLKGKIPAGLKIAKENFRLYCTPVINMFPRDAEPIRLDHLKTRYKIVTDLVNPQYLEVHSVVSVEGIISGSHQRHKYKPFYSFRHKTEEGDEGYYYNLTRETSPWGGWDTYLSFVCPKNTTLLQETISIELICTNGDLAKRVGIGDICRPTQDVPGFVSFSNITKPTLSLHMELGKNLEWRFISHLALNFVSITNSEALKNLLELYNVANTEANHRRIAGILEVTACPEQILLHGVAVMGTHFHITLDEKHFEDEGDVCLFASLLNEFISLYASINSFTKLTVSYRKGEGKLEWLPIIGKKSII